MICGVSPMTARILVVDDNPANVKLLATKLAHEYYTVDTAASGPEALQAVKNDPPDIILLDVMMPGMNGFEVCEKLRATPETAQIPVVMITALTGQDDRIRGLEAGADDYLSKPVNDTALMARVRSLVRLKYTLDEWKLRQQTSVSLGMDAPMSEAGLDAEGARVLVIDDFEHGARHIAELLGEDNQVASVATSGTEALSISGRGGFDLIMIALGMESEDGLRLCSRLRSAQPTRVTPIIVFGDEGDEARVAKALDLGVNDYILKPIDRMELRARTRSQIRRWRYQQALRNSYEETVTAALHDPLTGLFNRRYVTRHLEQMLKNTCDDGSPLAALTFDIDHFKMINDNHGHQSGDEVLVEVARRVTGVFRNADMVARMGGEEFVVILPEVDEQRGLALAERLRAAIADKPFAISAEAGQVKITVSVGAAVTRDPAEPPQSLLSRADEALYEAKNAGRNRVVAA
ncbi:MAG: PleD family two-component system response regulator [Alphaproteobacteria bacterium]